MSKAILYARVSSKDQAETGYSLQDQMRTLRAYAKKSGYEVVEEVEDAGYSGASLERPGLTRVRELVVAGDVTVVLAQDRDRIARDPVIIGMLKIEFEQHGTGLRALNDPEDDSPSSQLTVGILDQIAKFERTNTMIRTRRGKFERAREGKVIGSGSPPYGFKYDTDRTNYEVDATMATVRRMFEMLAAGSTLQGIKKTFEKEGVPTPGGGKHWYVPSMRRTILNDAYYPHCHDDLKELVTRGCLSEQVLATLDSDEYYGVWWYGINRVKLTPMSDRRRQWSRNPEEERVAIPVPDAGIPLETVKAARDALKRSYRPPKECKYFYELRAMLRCACCGTLMTGYSTGTRYRYYQCQNRRKHGKDAYPEGAIRRADDIEREVMCYVQVLISDREKLRAHIDEVIAKEREVLRDPDAECTALEKQIEGFLKLRSAYQDQQAAGLMTLEELGERLRQLEERRSAAENTLEGLRQGQRKIEELEANKRTLLEAFGDGILLGIDLFTPSMRRAIYEMLGLDILISPTGMRVRCVVDANVVRMTREVEEYAQRHMEVKMNGLSFDEGLPLGDGGFLEAWQRAASPKSTDKVMAEVAS